MFRPFRWLIDAFRERGAITPEKALTLKELGIPEVFESMKPPISPEIDPIVKVGNRYYLSEQKLASFSERPDFPSPIRKWIQHTAKVPKGFLRYKVLQKLKEQPMSGAELASIMEGETDGRWRPKPGSIYPLLKTLLRDGLTRELSDPDGRIRRYELTDKGLQFLKTEIEGSEELRMKFDHALSPFPGPFPPILDHLKDIPPPILHLFETLSALSIMLMDDPSPETLKELSAAAKDFSKAVENIHQRVKKQGEIN